MGIADITRPKSLEEILEQFAEWCHRPWTCGEPGCRHDTFEGATFHAEMLNSGLDSRVLSSFHGS